VYSVGGGGGHFLNLIDGAQTIVEKLVTRPDAETFAKTLKAYADARAALHRRMHQQWDSALGGDADVDGGPK